MHYCVNQIEREQFGTIDDLERKARVERNYHIDIGAYGIVSVSKHPQKKSV